MLPWIILSIIIVGLSFILAIRSMRDYQEFPEKQEDYGLFLIRNLAAFDADFLLKLSGSQISIERLFKANKTTLTIFGKRDLLTPFKNLLNLLELEDYTLYLKEGYFETWEVGVRDQDTFNITNIAGIFKNVPQMLADEQFFWQMVISQQEKNRQQFFKTQIRAAICSKNSSRREELMPELQKIGFPELAQVPRPYSGKQMFSFYHQRALSADTFGPTLLSGDILRLTKIT